MSTAGKSQRPKGKNQYNGIGQFFAWKKKKKRIGTNAYKISRL